MRSLPKQSRLHFFNQPPLGKDHLASSLPCSLSARALLYSDRGLTATKLACKVCTHSSPPYAVQNEDEERSVFIRARGTEVEAV